MYFIFFVMPLLSAIKVTVQGRYAQKNIKNFSDLLLYNGVVFLSTATILAIIFFRGFPPVEVLYYALIGAVSNVLFQTLYTVAMKNGPIAPTVIINTFGIIFTLIAGRIFYNEQWSIFTIIGFVFMAIAFYLVPARGENKKINAKWCIFTILAFLFSGVSNVIALVFAKSDFQSFKSEYLVLLFAIASIICFVFMLCNVKIKKERIITKTGCKLPAVALIISGALGAYNLLNIYAFQWFESYIVAPIINGAIIVVVMLINCVMNREKPSIKSLIGTACAVTAIVLLNL